MERNILPEGIKITRVDNLVTIEVLDVIGFWNDKEWLNWQLINAEGADIHFRIDSEGGGFLAGIAMMNLLKGYRGKVTTEGIGFVASAATFVLLGGDEATMVENSFMLIHEPRTTFGGTKDMLEKDSEMLKPMLSNAAEIYARKMESLGKKAYRKLIAK